MNSKIEATEFFETSLGLAREKTIGPFANTETVEQAEVHKEAQTVETTSSTAATVTQIKIKTPRSTNKRKTRTKLEQKQRRNNSVVRNGFLAGGKALGEIQPYLTNEICERLRSGSGRAYTNRAIREIIKAIAVSEKGAKAFFYHINGVVAYLIPALIKEKRCPEKTSSENYYTLAGMSEEDKLWNQREKYLASIEEEAIRNVCPENQLKAKLSNTLLSSKAYSLLTGLIKFQLVDNTMEIHLHSYIDFTENDKSIILSQVQAVYGDVRLIKFIIQESGLKAGNSNIQQQESHSNEKSEFLQLPQGVWGDVAKELVARYGVDTYKNWFSKLKSKIDENTSTIELNASSVLVKDWIGSRYENSIAQIAATMGFELRGLK